MKKVLALLRRGLETTGRLWTTPESTESLCLFRIVWATLLLIRMTSPTGWWRPPYFQLHLFNDPKHYLIRGYHASWFRHLPAPGYEGFRGLEDTIFVLSILLIIGLGTRWVAPALLLTYGYLMALSQFFYHHHLWLFLLGVLVLSLSRCNEHYSVDAWIRRRRRPDEVPPQRYPVPRRLLQALVGVIYLGGVSIKFSHYFLSGSAIRYLVKEQWVYETYRHGVVWDYAPVLAWAALFMELWMLLLVWWPPLRWSCLFVGFLLHAGLDQVMPVGTFSYQMLALLMMFIQPASHRLEARVPSGVIRPGRMLDWLQRVEWVALAPGEPVSTPGASGRSAWLLILMRLPLTFGLAFPVYAVLTAWRRFKGRQDKVKSART